MSGCVSGDGGGGGGGGDESEFVLRVLMINAHTEAHTLSYSGGAPLEDSPDGETAESCTAIIVAYGLEVPFELLVDGTPVMISDELPEGVPLDGQGDLIAVIDSSRTAPPSPARTSRAAEPSSRDGRSASRPPSASARKGGPPPRR
jgi:hypothetical protein